MKRLKKMIALMLTLCLVLTGAVPAYAEEMNVSEAAEIFGIAEDVFPAEAEYEAETSFDAEGEDLTAETLDIEEEITEVTIDGAAEEGTVITSEVPGSPFYVIEITYGLLRYRLGATSVLLSRILSVLQIPGEVFEAESMDPDLFTVEEYSQRKGEWVVTPVKSSESSGTLRVQAGKTIHEITILISDVKREDVRYRDEEGVMQTANCIILQSCTDYSFYGNEWYAVTGDIEVTNRIENKAPIGESSHLILADGARMSIKGGIHNGHESEITFYGQNNDSGELFVNSVTGYASAIGGDADESNGVIHIHGGRFDVLSAIFAAGIGAGMNGGIGTIEITGGTIKAEGGGAGAGIGGGIQCSLGGSITIKGGNITAVGGGNVATGIGAGIGSETHGDLEIDDEGLYIEVGQPGGKVKTCEEYRRDRDHYVYIHPGPRYTVKHYYQALDGKTYEPAQLETRRGHEGVLTRAVPHTPEGFSWLPFDQYPVKADGSTVVEIYYNRNPYAIIFDANGHGVAPQRINALYGQTISEPEPPTAVGFNFCGWYEDMDCTVPFEFTTMPSGGKILFAKWEKTTRKYEVTWMLNDITKIDVTEVLEGEMPVHENPTYQDRIFVGWQPELKKATGPAKYIAYFEARMGRQAVSFNTNGGSFVNTQLVDYYTRAERPEDPTKDGYTFAGWYREASFVTPYDFDDLVNADMILYAKWNKIAPSAYTVTWKENADKVIGTTVVMAGEMPVHSDPVKEGYIFTGWNPSLSPVISDITYTAKFVKRDARSVVVRFSLGDGLFGDTQVLSMGDKAVRPADPVKTGYVFEGWYADAAYTTLFDFNKAVRSDIMIYAKWRQSTDKMYTVTWKQDIYTVINTTSVKENTMPVHEDAMKAGFVFVGWDPSLSPVTADVTYTARFVQKEEGKAIVRFSLGGGIYVDTQILPAGEKAVRPEDPVKTGYTFEGWYTDTTYTALYDFDMPVTEDITICAKWKLNKAVFITWKDWDGSILVVSETVKGEVPKYPGVSKPARSGYIFTGWTPEIDLAYADTTYTATYAPQTIINGGGGGGSAPAAKKAAVTFSSNWYADNFGVWRIKNSAGHVVTNAWLCDDAVAANGQNVWYLLTQDGAMLAAGLVQDNTGNFYSLETNHDGYFGMLRYTDGYYNCNGQQVYLQFSQKHDGTFGAVINAEGIEKLKAIYGVTQYGIGNENAVYTKTF